MADNPFAEPAQTSADDPAAAAPDQTVDEAAAENERLRAELDAENASLRDRLEQSKAASASAETNGLTDEDVRRLEHPDEFAG